MAAFEDTLVDELKCPICRELLNDPKALGCLHRFCRDCLENHIRIRTYPGSSSVSCPVCRKISRVSYPGAINVDSFVTDVGVRNVVQALKRKREDTFLCDRHTGNPVVLYCKSCEVKLCHVCSGIDHRGCEGVVSLQSVAAEERKHVTGLLVKLKTKRGSVEKASEHVKHETEMLKTRHHEEIKAARERFKKVRQILSRSEEQLKIEIDKEFRKVKNRYQLKEERLRDEIRATTEAEKYMEKSLTKTDIQLFYQNCQEHCPPIAFQFDKTSDISFDKKVKSLMKETKLSDIELLLTQQESVHPKDLRLYPRKRVYPSSPDYASSSPCSSSSP